MHKATVCSLGLITLLLSTSAAHAEDYEPDKSEWPLAEMSRPLTLAKSMFEARGDTMIINLSKDSVGDPIALAPDLYFGVNGKLTVGITHETGICLAGDACVDTYNDTAIDVLYGLMRGGNLELALRGGITIPAFDPFVSGLHVGAVTRLRVSSVAIRLEPSLYIGATERDVRKETVSFPVWVQVRVKEQIMGFVSTGLFGPLSGFGDAYTIPVGLGASYALNNRIDFGAEIAFTNLAGKGNSADGRVAILRGALRL